MSGALEEARAQVESIKRLVSALSVDYDRLEELRELMFEGEVEGFDEEELSQLEAASSGSDSLEEAVDAIHSDTLSVEVRSGWGSADSWQAEEFRIVLSTGGPHIELRGELDNNSEPREVGVFYSDGWAEGGELLLTSEEKEIVLTYCKQFYFGE